METGDLMNLLTPEGLRLLDDVTALESSLDIVAHVPRLRKQGFDAGLVATVVTQARLRHKARGKFGEFADRISPVTEAF